MKPDKAEMKLAFNRLSKVLFFPDLSQIKKLNIKIGMGFFHSKILIIVIDVIHFNRDIFLPKIKQADDLGTIFTCK